MLFGNFKILKQSIFFFFFFGYVAMNAQNLEDEIYKVVDEFVIDKTDENLKTLTKKQQVFERKVTTKQEKLALVILLCNKAFYLKSSNQPAINTYEKAWKLFSKNKLSNYDIVEYCLKPLGNLYIKNKDYTNAENIIKHYIFLSEKSKSFNHQIGGVINLSILYQSIGNHKKVIEIVDELLLKKAISVKHKETAQNIKAHSLLFFDKKHKETTQSGDYNKYKLLLKREDYKQALYYLNKHIKNVGNKKLSNREKVKQFIEKSQLLFLLKDTVSSSKAIKNGLEYLLQNKEVKKENLYAETLLIDAFDLLAELNTKAPEKLKYYDYAFYVAELLEENITSQQAKIIHQNDNRKRSEKCIELFYELYTNTKESKYFEKALQYAEKYKSGVVSEKMQRQKLLKKHSSDSLLLKEKELLLQQEKLTNILIIEQTKPNSKASKISDLSKRLNQISVELKTIQGKVAKKYQKEISSSISLEDVFQKLKEKNISLVNYFYGKNAIYQFIIQEKDIEFNQIQLSEELKNDIINFIRLFDNVSIINNNVKSYIEKAHKIYKNLNIDALKDQKNVLIVPDGLLNFVPFETMVTSKTSNLMYAKIPFLVKKSQVVYSVNISSFLQQKHSSKKDNVLGFFPVFSNTNKELRYSLNESKAINRFKKVKTLLKSKATKKNFIDFSNDYDILHLSTHAKGGNFYEVPTIDFVDETLTLNELYTLNLNSQLAVLSACETGVGVSTKGEGILSISRGFQYAGVPNVLFSLWSINDKSTAVLMNFFYKELKRSNSINFANQQSKKTYLQDKNIKNSKKSPYYWGAFVYYGTFEKTENSSSSSYWLLELVILLISLLLYLKRR